MQKTKIKKLIYGFQLEYFMGIQHLNGENLSLHTFTLVPDLSIYTGDDVEEVRAEAFARCRRAVMQQIELG